MVGSFLFDGFDTVVETLGFVRRLDDYMQERQSKDTLVLCGWSLTNVDVTRVLRVALDFDRAYKRMCKYFVLKRYLYSID